MALLMPRDEYDLLKRLAIQLGDLVAATSVTEAPCTELCGVRSSPHRDGTEGTPCDRVKDHPGLHTWELGEQIGRLTISGDIPSRERVWKVPEGKVRELCRWLASPSGAYYPSDLSDASLVFEAAVDRGIRVRVRL